jgi:hypothetical protein
MFDVNEMVFFPSFWWAVGRVGAAPSALLKRREKAFLERVER